MTEAEWWACTDPQRMLDFLKGKTSHRKLRLFACACYRRTWHLLTDERSRRGVEAAEQYAEGDIGEEELYQARLLSHAAYLDARASEALATGHSPKSDWTHCYAAGIPFAAYSTTCGDTPGDADYGAECIIDLTVS